MTCTRLLIAAVFLTCFSLHTNAQNNPPTAKDTGLALEVVFLKNHPPAFQTVGRFRSEKGAWYALFGRVPGWQLPPGALPIDAVKLVPYLRDETVNIRVSVLRGKFQDVEDSVGVYKARENESFTVNQLVAFGVEPFVIKVVRPALTSDFPVARNLTRSAVVVGLQPVISALPHYQLTLHNLSDKNISALSIKILREGRVRLETMPQGNYGEPVIKAGESAELNKALGTKLETTIESDAAAPEILIESLIFADGTYEGEPKPAAAFLGFAVGRRIELRRLLPLLDNAALSGNDAATAANLLRSQLSTLSYDADEREVASLVGAFPSLEKSDLRIAVDVAIHAVRKDLLAQLGRVEKAEANATTFSAWLVRTRKLYTGWLANLEGVKVNGN